MDIDVNKWIRGFIYTVQMDGYNYTDRQTKLH